jgi:transcriptional regulator with XRE-family HTH domain
MFGKWLKEQRLNAGLTQKELANLLGLTTETIGYFETGARTPGLSAMKKISEFFNISIYEIRQKLEKSEL